MTTDLKRENEQLRRDLELLGAANDALRAELAALRVGSVRGTRGLDTSEDPEAKRQRFVRWPPRRKA